MNHTPFPVTPGEVVALTAQEFTFDLDDLDDDRIRSFDRVCRTFVDDVNRALVWWIRFKALKTWCGRADVTAHRNSGAVTLRDACEVAASFSLNHRWEFEVEEFRSAVEAVGAGRVGSD